MKVLKPNYHSIAYRNGDDVHTRSLTVRASARELKGLNLYSVAYDLGLTPYGCNCSHCRNDWDCCGRLFPAHHKVERMKRGFRVVTEYQRNI